MQCAKLELPTCPRVLYVIEKIKLRRPMRASSSGAAATSATLPGVSRSVNGRPTTSVRAWILVVQPPRERPIACALAPFYLRTRRAAP